MKYFTLIIIFLLFSCEKKEDVLLPKSNITIVKDVEDHSPIYIFFKIEGKDTIADVNRKNSIISTNWLFNIDKRLPLKLVIPEVIKLQEKKRADSAHKNENAENYYSYADSIGKNLAFLPFTKVYYKIGKPESKFDIISFRKGSDLVSSNGLQIKKTEFIKEFYAKKYEVTPNVVFLFDKNMSYQEYIQNKILIGKFKGYNVDELPIEFIF
ncbi:hypothetical protein [Flavobacterium sp. KBS0721]|uniref:hypothetical protein n=1 Tax=Flavobacterium sp. KBS0721 TaxID=1179672 RepID=UPI00098EC29D|nr:hypothetical protein [Flavobacterium sp. KBS0721]QDW21238.1 hypothetical protein B0M43_0014335 [Flavobacterium sp. KBS0721]